jgi:hypothetical protein
MMKDRGDHFPEWSAAERSFSTNHYVGCKKGACSLPVVPPSETGVAVPPVEREGAEGASARSVNDGSPNSDLYLYSNNDRDILTSYKWSHMVSKLEWDAIKKKGCLICGISDEESGGLIKCHLKAKSKEGSQIIPLCPNHHSRFDKGKLTPAELKKIGIDPDKYEKYRPKKGSSAKSLSVIQTFEKSQKDSLKKFQKDQDKAMKSMR